MVIDKRQISRDAYRNLITIEDELPREWMVSEQRTQINKEMNSKIKITTAKMSQHINTDPIENPDIFDLKLVDEVMTSVGKAGYRSVKDILRFTVLNLIKKDVLNLQQPIINLRISGDGRNVGRKVKHVMITFVILDDVKNIYNPNNHHTVVLYPESKNYESLNILIASF